MQTWKTYKISDFIEMNPRLQLKAGQLYSFVEMKDLDSNNKYVLPSIKKELKGGSRFQNGDTLFARITPCLENGKICQVKGIETEYAFGSTEFLVLRGKQNISYSDFVFYLSRTPELRLFAESNMIGTSGRQRVAKEAFSNLEITLPPLPEQRAIASILSALDDKIELNLQMNKTLEEMAMALYKHWFVDFGPFKDGKFIDSELGMIPEGWEVKTIGEMVETIGGGTPKTNITEYWENGDIDWYSPTDLTSSNSLFSLGTSKKITALGLQKSSSKLLPKGSLLMSSRATIGALTITRKKACTNQGFISMIPNEKISVFQLHGWTKCNAELILSKANGSTFKEISKSEFRALPILKGKDIEGYLNQSETLYSLIENNILENQYLINKRNSLLPKLISGAIRVKDLEVLQNI
jgi:type I restriction enzyme S subunit